jgi:hypothetical protein
MNRAPLLSFALLLSACSAQVDVQTEPFTQAVPVTSIGADVYAEVAIDLPEEAQGTDLLVRDVSADLVVVNPTRALSLQASARLSLQGRATPDAPVLYTNANRPPYFDQSTVLLEPRTFSPGQRVPVRIEGAALTRAIGQPRIWLIVSNTVTSLGIGADRLPVEIRLEDIVLRATVEKDFPGLGGALEVGGL